MAYPITALQLQQQIATHFKQVAGGLVGTSLLAPNNLQQFFQVASSTACLMLDPFVQAITGGAGRSPLARIYGMGDSRRPTTGVAWPSVVPPGVVFPSFM